MADDIRTPSARLEALTIELPQAPAAVGAYVQARRHGDLIFVTGQLAFVDGAILHPGVLGDGVDEERGRQAARACALNSIAAAADAVGGVDKIDCVLQIVGYLACTDDFSGHSAVLNGASELFVDVFGESGRHTRTNVGVNSLPLRTPIELQVTFAAIAQ